MEDHKVLKRHHAPAKVTITAKSSALLSVSFAALELTTIKALPGHSRPLTIIP
jgi:hypothetical protein